MCRLALLLGATTFIQCCSYAQTGRHTITFTNIHQSKGKIYIAWYNNASRFSKKDKSLFWKIIDADGSNTVSVSFAHLEKGVYAIAAFLDENGNGKMDTNFLGIPKEKYGFSNNARPLMRAANFQEASFRVDEKDSAQQIKLK
jgi:uncharacterized protein (DUF2141 family)